MFFFEDKRMLYVILGILVLMSIINLSSNSLLGLVLTIPGVIIAITFHEFAHAFAAVKLGDNTPRNQGRLSLNPLNHMDPFGFVLLIFAHIGWGKPVEINPRNFDKKISMDTGEAIVSLAGPAMNFVLAILFTIIYVAILKFNPGILLTQIGMLIMTIIQYTAIVNIGLGVFNLIPLPPLDGSKIFKRFLSYNAKRWIEEKEQIFYIVFLVLWITGLAGTIISPIINAIYRGISWVVLSAFGIL